ncbi:MAG TPA: CHAT domain-containing protein [Blastocatellia bacterium]|nr:CHAT domain-containing protein [Blastocatellia bacterium]
MNLQPEENLFRWYLLGGTSPEEDEQIEQRLQHSEAWREELQLAEEDLIDDYARGGLTEGEREMFKQNYLITPERRQNLLMAQAALQYAAQHAEAVSKEGSRAPSADKGASARWPHRWATIFRPGWKIAVYATIVAAVGLGIRFWPPHGEAEVQEGLAAFAQAYRSQRPLEARISGLPYSRFDQARGNGSDPAASPIVDYLAHDRAARILLDAVKNRPSAVTHQALGQFYLAEKRFDVAIAEFEAALKGGPAAAALHSDLGAALMEKLQSESDSLSIHQRPELENRALDHLNRALALDGRCLEALFNRALLYQSLKLYPSARSDWQQYLSYDRNSPWAEEARKNLDRLQQKAERVGAAPDGLYRDFLAAYRQHDEDQAWQAYSRSYQRHGNYITEKLLDEFLDQAARGEERAARETIGTLGFLGRICERRSGDRFNSLMAAAYQQADPRRRGLLARGRELRRQAYTAAGQTDQDRALSDCLDALRQFTAAGVIEERLMTEYWLAETYLRHAEQKRSLELFTRVARQWSQRGCRWWYAMTCNRLANVHADLEEFSDEVKSVFEAKQIFAGMEDESGVLRTLITLSNLYQVTGKYHDSIAFAHQSLESADRLAMDDRWIITSYAIAAGSFKGLSLFTSALEFQRAAVQLAERLRQPQTISRYYVQLGLIYEDMGDFEAAIKNIRTGLAAGEDRSQPMTNEEIRAYGLLHLGRVLRRAGRYDAARQSIDQAAGFYREKSWEGLSYFVARERLLIHIALKDVPAVRRELNGVFRQFEVNRTKILHESLRNGFFDTQQEIYDAAIKFADQVLRQPEEAFAYSELSRSRSLLDAAAGTRRAITNDPAGPDLLLSASTAPLPLAEIQRRLPPQAQLLQFALLDDRLIIWLLSGSGIAVRQVPITATELTGKVSAYLKQLSNPNSGDDAELRRSAGELGSILIGPVEDLLDRDRVLGVVPDKILNYLPPGALISPRTGQYLVADYAIVCAPSATLFIRSSENAARKTGVASERLLSIGNPSFSRRRFPDLPNLPEAADEADEVAALYQPRSVLTGRMADKQALVAAVERADVIHLAMHYVVDADSPLLSRLPLAASGDENDRQDDYLEMREVYRLRLARARLVVLSACRTRAEELYKGEGIIGLSRPFETAGVPLIVSSLWPVDSNAAKKLMVDFHHLRKEERLPTIQALKQAQQHLLYGADQRLRHPYYWAVFVVTGGYSTF